jgi:hypothetical protein
MDYNPHNQITELLSEIWAYEDGRITRIAEAGTVAPLRVSA